MKQVATITAKQFGFVYLDGIPYNPAKVERFMSKGAGIKLQDIVIFEADEDNVLSYIKNALYRDGSELRMVKEYVKDQELKKAQMADFQNVSDEIKKQLAEEGVVITNDGIFKTPAEPATPSARAVEMTTEMSDSEFPQELLDAMLPDQRRTISILLQSSLKIASDRNPLASLEDMFAEAIKITRWVDRNSTQIITSNEEFIARKVKK